MDSDMEVSDSSIYFLDLDSQMTGGLRAPSEIINWYRTCFIDSVLNAIANSDTLVERFKNILPESKFSDDDIINAFLEGMPKKYVLASLIDKDMHVPNNKLKLYEILGAIFIRGIDSYPKDVLLYVTLYIMYLENSTQFNKRASNVVKEMDPRENFYTYVCNTDHNFVIYFRYCDKMIKRNDMDPQYTGVHNNMLITKLGLNHKTSICDYSEIQGILDKCINSDVFIEFIYVPTMYNETVIQAMFDICLSKYAGGYCCTDIIFDEYENDDDIAYHSIYYNVNESLLHNNSVISKIDITSLSKQLHNGKYYVPRILHYQRIIDM